MAKARRRGIKRYLSSLIVPQETQLPRLSSFPFVSGDTFRALAGIEFLQDHEEIFLGRPRHIGFATPEVVVAKGFVERYRLWLSKLERAKPTLIIHNGDLLPSPERLRAISELSSAVFCVNLVNDVDNLVAIPIGLENAHRNKNGRLDFYLDRGEGDLVDRSRMVLSSFHVENNSPIRQPLRNLMAESRFGYDGVRWKLGEYRTEVSRTKFVICPPGNGNDTHRTWEAIYLGAVPVVMRGHIAASLVEDLPVVVVENYEEFLALDDSELSELFVEMRKRNPEKAYFPHWLKRVL